MENTFKNSFFKNASIAFGVQIFNLLITFAVRTVFVKMLGNDYLSLNGLFTNVVSLLSFAELGIGNAIIFSLYEPIAKGKQATVVSLMCLFKKAYRWIRITIIVLGLLLVPFVDYLIKDININQNFKVIFLLFLINTYVSYFYAYKKSLLIADQKNYIVSLIQQTILVVQSVLQCVLLVFTHNYILYLLIQIISTITINIITSKYVDELYPYLSTSAPELNRDERMSIFDNIKNIFFYKIGAVILNSTDNILISTLIATKLVGLYSNYSMLIAALNSVLMQVCNSIAATIGNYNVVNSTKKNEETFNCIFFLSFWVFGICTVCLSELLNPFVRIWLGTEYLLENSTIIIISLVFYITGINQIPSQYRTSFGIFKQAKFVPIIAAILNVVFSVVLGKLIGLNGIFIATIIAKLFTFNIVDPILIYRIGFRRNYSYFFVKKLVYFFILIGSFIITHFINNCIPDGGIMNLIIKAMISFTVSNIVFVLLLFRTKEFRTIIGGLFHVKN